MHKVPPKWYQAMNKRQHTLLPMWEGFAILGGLFYKDLFIPNQLTFFENGLGDYYTDSKDSFQASITLSKKVRKNPLFWQEYDKQIYSLGQKGRERLLILGKHDYKEETNQALLAIFNELMDMLKLQGGTLTLARIVAQKELDEFLNKKLSNAQKAEEAHGLIRVPVRESWPILEIINFLQLVKKAKESDLKQDGIDELLQEHQYLWGWITTDLHYGIPFSLDELRERFNEEAKDYKQRLKEHLEYLPNLRKQREDLIKKLKPDDYLLGQMNMLAFETWLKTYRRYFTTQVIYYGMELFTEIAKRANIDLDNLWWATPDEIRAFLKEGKKLNEGELRQRYGYMVLLTLNGQNKIYLGKDAEELLKKEIQPKKIEYAKVLHGRPASLGKAEGLAKVILDHSKVEEIIKEGDIIVTTQAPPSFIRAIKRSKAVLAEEGATTSHASILCREFNKPCIVGLENLTKIVRTGEELLVNADEGVVERL